MMPPIICHIRFDRHGIVTVRCTSVLISLDTEFSFTMHSSQIILSSIFRSIRILCHIKRPVCVGSVIFNIIRKCDCIFSCQKTVSFCIGHCQELTAAVQMDCLSPVMIFQCIASGGFCAATCKATAFCFRIKVKIGQQHIAFLTCLLFILALLGDFFYLHIFFRSSFHCHFFCCYIFAGFCLFNFRFFGLLRGRLPYNIHFLHIGSQCRRGNGSQHHC